MAFIGNTVQTQGFIPATDTFSGNGSTTAFTLSRPVASVQQVQAVISNVVQDPNSAYTVSGNTLTFTSAPPSGTNNIYVRYTSLITQVIAPSQGTVGNTQFSSSTTSIPFAVGGPLGGGNSSIMKNRIINGAMVIDQRNAGASVTITTNPQYTLDRWAAVNNASSKFSVQQNAGSVTPPTGFTNYLGVTSLAATTVGAGDYYQMRHLIEGYNVADLGFGSVNAKTITLSFWVRSSLTGTFSVSVINGGENRFYPSTYTILAANTWEQKTITIPGDVSGTWLTTNGIGLILSFSMGVGTNYTSSASNTWVSSLGYAVNGSTNIVSTSGATFYITGVQLEVGSSATGFEYVNYQTSLANCQRYYINAPIATLVSAVVNGFASAQFPVTMRTNPTIVISPSSGSAGGATVSTFGWYSSFTAITGIGYTASAEL